MRKGGLPHESSFLHILRNRLVALHVGSGRSATDYRHARFAYGVVAEQTTGYPGYDSFITKDKATIGRILTDNGYHKAWFGKNHNTPEFRAS